MSRRKICVVTGTRADYGLLYWPMKGIEADPELELQVVVTGMHLSPEFGLTYRVIEQDGFRISDKVEMLLSSDTPIGIAKSMGLGVIGFSESLARLDPDLLLLLGDRFEILAAAQAALVARLPIAHICGGDTTEGAFDEAIRHSITKMSHLHFVTNEQAVRRVRQLGEDPSRIFNVGSPGIDQIVRLDFLDRGELEQSLGFTFRRKNLLVTFHPVTLEMRPVAEQFQALLDALDLLGPEVGIIFTLPNSDTEGRVLIDMIENYVSGRSHAKAYVSLGQLRYLSLVAQVDAVVGNSSSGLYEVPSFKKPTVNIGDRQKGRLQASSVINCEPETASIVQAVQAAFRLDCRETVNPYGDGDSSDRIMAELKRVPDYRSLLKKHFFDLTE
ncbi:UDP-N-acetylglucosamine 2-epimerase (hydrolyzing) [Geomonas nitrogeniifigens]|uniref:UDP-N-acetylglucosamine 2-epimerase (Hydrolyzing) n=1 Tax=Geomonas diazotrophica TaxID=2843197 RepID=A0ABX8JC73_9BACT|nr:UDP-N-acetylglucosamine 2-epimerase [Geomonas nitrogeniifigens]QWV95975.1 UDP-N-acetylglucosamine 2-epimerase (hydrolyzing) [Geomonas nitrogeniifigens]